MIIDVINMKIQQRKRSLRMIDTDLTTIKYDAFKSNAISPLPANIIQNCSHNFIPQLYVFRNFFHNFYVT